MYPEYLDLQFFQIICYSYTKNVWAYILEYSNRKLLFIYLN
jgi:hypothetical protein